MYQRQKNPKTVQTHTHQREAASQTEKAQSARQFTLSPASIMKLQRTIGNQAVQRLLAQSSNEPGTGERISRTPDKANQTNHKPTVTPLAAGDSTLQKDAKTPKGTTKVKWSEVVSELDGIKKASNDRLVKAHSYMEEGLKTADATKAKLDTAAGHYEQAYDNYERIINKAKKQASSREGLLNTFVNIGVGVALGMVSGALLPATAGIGVRLVVEFLTEVGEAGVSSQLGKLTDQSVDAFKPTGMNPMALRAKHYEGLVKLYRDLAITGKDSLAQALLLTKITELSGQAQLLDAGVKAKMKPEDILDQTKRLKPLVEPVAYPAGSIQSLKDELAKKVVPSVRELEQYLWIQWISTFGHYEEALDRYVFGDTDVLDNNTIEGYLHGPIGILGDDSLLDVDFGRYTTEDDEEEAVVAANDKWGEIISKYRNVL